MTKDDLIKVTYVGGPTAILEIDGFRFITDPTFDSSGSLYKSGAVTLEKTQSPAISDVGKLDAVLLSHDQHFDNLDNAGRLLLEKIPKTYTTVGGAERLKGNSFGLSIWQSDTIKTANDYKIKITATPARHGPAGVEKLTGEVTGFVLSVSKDIEEFEIYITGDTVYFEGVREVSEKFSPKYVFAFAGAAQTRGVFNLTMNTNDVIDTAFAFPDATIIPLHYEGWKHFTQNADDLKSSFEAIGIKQRLKILTAGVETILAV